MSEKSAKKCHKIYPKTIPVQSLARQKSGLPPKFRHAENLQKNRQKNVRKICKKMHDKVGQRKLTKKCPKNLQKHVAKTIPKQHPSICPHDPKLASRRTPGMQKNDRKTDKKMSEKTAKK